MISQFQIPLFLQAAIVIALLLIVYVVFRLKKRKHYNDAPKSSDEANYVILYGSETGGTERLAKMLHASFLAHGKKAHVSTLSKYCEYPQATHLIVFTATYGLGEAPMNAERFVKRIHTVIQPNKLKYTVLGFGSYEYPEFCNFAIEVEALLANNDNFSPLLPLQKVHNQSFSSITNWLKDFNSVTGLSLQLENPIKQQQIEKQEFTVIERTELNVDATFLLRLRSTDVLDFESGDLLAVTSSPDEIDRMYSIAKIDGDVLICVKKHELGKCSSYLSELTIGESVQAGIKMNEKFHLPVDKPVLMIANGTGIGPFLGMFTQKSVEKHLFWGVRTRASESTVLGIISESLSSDCLTSYSAVYSQEGEGAIRYVQHLVVEKSTFVFDHLDKGGVIMICGSVAMQGAVVQVLSDIIKSNSGKDLSAYENDGQLLLDCY